MVEEVDDVVNSVKGQREREPHATTRLEGQKWRRKPTEGVDLA